jgi:hypothetical protein
MRRGSQVERLVGKQALELGFLRWIVWWMAGLGEPPLFER